MLSLMIRPRRLIDLRGLSIGLPVTRPAGTWSLLLDVAALGQRPDDVSRRLLSHKVAATPMTGWGGDVADRHVRLVFSNEPVPPSETARRSGARRPARGILNLSAAEISTVSGTPDGQPDREGRRPDGRP